MPNVHYYECEFGYEKPEQGTYSICVKGLRKPTKKEAERFCASDMNLLGLTHCLAVDECSHEEAKAFYDMEQEERFPTFGKEVQNRA